MVLLSKKKDGSVFREPWISAKSTSGYQVILVNIRRTEDFSSSYGNLYRMPHMPKSRYALKNKEVNGAAGTQGRNNLVS